MKKRIDTLRFSHDIVVFMPLIYKECSIGLELGVFCSKGAVMVAIVYAVGVGILLYAAATAKEDLIIRICAVSSALVGFVLSLAASSFWPDLGIGIQWLAALIFCVGWAGMVAFAVVGMVNELARRAVRMG